ncbi:MAG: alpha/beta fold hydrolase [Flavobacteriales bacterium]
MQQRIETYGHKGLALRYIAAGQGSHLVIAFHGFGRSPDEFLPMISESEMLLLCFYLPGHPGAAEITAEQIELDVWCQLLEMIIERHKPKLITVVGYSLGGRIALSTCMNWRIKNFRLVLLAPDGIKMSGLQRFAMKHKWGMRLFRGLMRYPAVFIVLTQTLVKIGLLSNPLGHFLLRQLREDSRRQVIMKVFPLFREFISSESVTRNFLQSLSDRLLIVLGKHDPVIPVMLVKKLPSTVVKKSVLIIDEASHDLLSVRFVQRWKSFLLDLKLPIIR